MEKQLEILMVEDDPADAFRLTHELKSKGLSFQSRCVVTREDFLRAIQQATPDVILSDHGLPSFTGFAALEIAREKCPQVPFIFVTGHYDQGMMVEMFESGAVGYVYKNHLPDLVPAINKALADLHRQRTAPPEMAKERTTSPSNMPPKEPTAGRDAQLICSHCQKVRTESGTWEQISAYLRKHRTATVTLALCPQCAASRQPHFDF